MIEMEERLITHLDECLAAIEAGETLEGCLARYPDEADQLAPFLRIALALEDLPQPGPSGATTRAAKTRFLAEAEHQRASAQKERVRPGGVGSLAQRITDIWSRTRGQVLTASWTAPVRALGTAALALALVLLIGGGAIHAASGSLPGDPLYGFKLLGEDIQRAFTLSDDGRIRLEETFTERRVTEVGHLLTLRRPEEVAFGGLLRERTADGWRVADIPVVVNAQTQVQGDLKIGLYIQIQGITQADGTVLARSVEIAGEEIVGRIEIIAPAHWRVAGKQIQVHDSTYLPDQLRVGDCAEVRARRFSDGTLLALEIERSAACSPEDQGREEDGTITPTPGASPNPMPTPTLTATPSPTALPTATPTPSPSVTATPSITPMPEATANPSPSAEPDDNDDDKEATPTLQPPPTSTSSPPVQSPVPTDDSGDDDDDHDGGNNNDDDSNANDDDGGNNNENSNEDDDAENANDNGNLNGDDDGEGSNGNDSLIEDSGDDIGGVDNSHAAP
jgi:hypothetical protein